MICLLQASIDIEELPSPGKSSQRQIAKKAVHENRSNAVQYSVPQARQRSDPLCYPRATSNVVITAKPDIAPMVATSVCFSSWDSGINSSTTTYIIAPAANAKHGIQHPPIYASEKEYHS
jgi:hypothetical protein